MGIFSDFVIAAPDEGEEIATYGDLDGEDLGDRWPTLAWERLDDEDLCKLASAITGQEHSNDWICHSPEEAEALVFEIPDGIVRTFAGVDAGALPAIAHRWAQSYEPDERPSVEDGIEVLGELSEHARKVGAGQSLFLKISGW